MALVLVHLCDIQFGYYSGNRGLGPERERLRWAVDRIRQIKPAAVIMGGDMVNRPGSEHQRRAMAEVLAQAGQCRIIFVPGNHELGNPPTVRNLEWFRAGLGPDHGVWYREETAIVWLNSCILQTDASFLSDEVDAQNAWFKRISRTRRFRTARFRLLFLHHPFFAERRSEPTSYFNLSLSWRNWLLEQLGAYGYDAVFSGHYHRRRSHRFGAIRLEVTGPLGKPLGDGRSGFSVVRMEADRMAVRFVRWPG